MQGERKNEWGCEQRDGSDSKKQHGKAVVDQPKLACQAQKDECELSNLHVLILPFPPFCDRSTVYLSLCVARNEKKQGLKGPRHGM
jgi:hypothetical protein